MLFGGTGDLAKRMVIPAFYTLFLQKLLPGDFVLIGNGRGDVSHEDFRGHVHDVLTEFGTKPEGKDWQEFSDRLRFAGGGFDSDDPGSLLDVIAEAQKELGDSCELIHYLAVPPVAFADLTAGLGAHNLAKGARVVYEKPFGTSPENFRELNEAVHKVLDESQVYRIDHFLGKEATQDLHVLRFANSLFADAWNAEHIKSVQIDAPEKLDIDDRALFYDATGAMLDMLITHLFQVAAEVAMEPPASMDAQDLQSAREEVIGCFRPLDPAEVVLGQYDGYLDVDGIKPGSTTDTFVAARMWVDNDRWRGVPFLMRTGKRMAGATQRVSVILREPTNRAVRCPERRWRADLLAGRQRRGRTVDGGQGTRSRARSDGHRRVHRARRGGRGRRPCPLRPADPRRTDRRPVAVHPPGRPGQCLERSRAGPGSPAGGAAVRAGQLGPGGCSRAGGARSLAARPVAAGHGRPPDKGPCQGPAGGLTRTCAVPVSAGHRPQRSRVLTGMAR